MRYPRFEEKSIAAVAFNQMNRYGKRDYIYSLYKDGHFVDRWEAYTWEEMRDEVEALAGAWSALGLPSQGKVAIMAKNRPRWVFTAISIFASGGVLVPVYPTLKADDAKFILQDSEAKFIVVDTLKQAEKILPIAKELGSIEKLYVMEPFDGETDDIIEPYEALLSLGKQHIDTSDIAEKIESIEPDALTAIIYTSGTTGRPKGVMLSNKNFLSQRIILESFNLGEQDTFLNHLPFCHSFGLTTDMMGSIAVGSVIAIGKSLHPKDIRRGLAEIQPTVLMSVPRLFEKIYLEVQHIISKQKPWLQKLFTLTLKVGKDVFDYQEKGQRLPLRLTLAYKAARFILDRVRARAGLQKVRVAYAGGGPTSRELCHFFQGIGIDIYQGYGLTETGPIANVNLPHKNRLGTVGPPIPGVEEKIAKDGEILIRGPNVTSGYFKAPELTAEVFDEEGWFYSGDIGYLDEMGYLVITDRKKELIVTSGGKNIPPLPIESAFTTDTYIERVVVIGDDHKYLTALVCPNFRKLHQWAKVKGLAQKTDKDLAALPEIHDLLMSRVAQVNQGLASFEQIKKITVMDHDFSEKTGELTPTQKVKRRVVSEMYADAIASMYPSDDSISSKG